MKQAIAGVAPAESSESVVMVVWPSIASFPSGRFLGRLFGIRWPDVYIFRLGSLLALLAIPFALLLYFWRLLPSAGKRYALTNRRVIVQTAVTGIDLAAIELDGFDSIEIDVLPGQAWFDAGDLSFRRHDNEVFRLAGVQWPEAFRQNCLKSHRAYVGVRQALVQELHAKSA
ncbi:MAG: PH domain-containing protein [Pirellulaceae bacterium]|jgi:hypothetical protein|nr:PH domain-containing protein [Pirellulaceae bacterium]